MRRIPSGSTAIAVIVAVALSVLVRAQAPETPELTRPVNDFANVIDSQSESAMETQIRALQAATGDSVVVATVPSLDGFTGIEELAVKMFENHGRGIGAKGKDNGVLIVVAPKDRKVRIEVGYDLEQWITDGYSGETIREFMAPSFRRNEYGEGLLAATTRIIGRIAQARGVTINGVQAPRPRSRGGDTGAARLGFILLIFLFVALMGRIGGGRGGGSSSWRGGRGWSGWSSGVGGFGGGWDGGRGGGFGGGFGGFGGGRSGGGGASGSW